MFLWWDHAYCFWDHDRVAYHPRGLLIIHNDPRWFVNRGCLDTSETWARF